MPAAFWGEAVSTAVFILNRSPTKALKGATPFEAWHGRKPDVSFLRTFGCVAHVKVTKPGASKLDDRSTPMVFLGYEQGSKAYRLYDPRARRVHVSRDVIFDENRAWSWEESGDGEAEGGVGSEFVVERVEYEDLAHEDGGEVASPGGAAASPGEISPVPGSPVLGAGEDAAGGAGDSSNATRRGSGRRNTDSLRHAAVQHLRARGRLLRRRAAPLPRHERLRRGREHAWAR
ncbi:unnamed protein product [Urochloa humidicola]